MPTTYTNDREIDERIKFVTAMLVTDLTNVARWQRKLAGKLTPLERYEGEGWRIFWVEEVVRDAKELQLCLAQVREQAAQAFPALREAVGIK